jgi:hypothetical protein
VRVTQPDFEELRRQRDKLLAQVGMERDHLEDRARRGMLAAEDFWVWREIRSIEFLMEDSDERGRAGESS